MTCPLEKKFVSLLEESGIAYTRPENDARDPTNLDFHLTDFNIYVEVKQFHTPRIADQLERVPERSSALVLVGPKSVEAFVSLVTILAASQPEYRPMTPEEKAHCERATRRMHAEAELAWSRAHPTLPPAET